MKIPKIIKAPRFTKLMSVFIDVHAITLFPFIICNEAVCLVCLSKDTSLTAIEEIVLFELFNAFISRGDIERSLALEIFLLMS